MAFKISITKSAILAISIIFLSGANAQSPPPELKSLMENNRSDSHVIYVDKLTDEQRKFFDKNAKAHPDGYRERIEADVRATQIIENLLRRKETGPEKKPSIFSSMVNTDRLRNVQYLGEFREGEFRTSLFFKDASGALILLTITDLLASKYRAYVIRERLNTEINGKKGTMTLNIHEPTKRAIWMARWINGNYNFELRINDTVDANRRPTKRPQEVIDIAKEIVK